MPTQRIRRRSCRRIRSPYNNLNEIVGTTKRSIEASPSAWLRRNVLQPCDGGRLRRAMYLATEVWTTSMPSLRSSPWMRGAPPERIGKLIARISRRISSVTFGLPTRGRDFQRQKERKPARCQRIRVRYENCSAKPPLRSSRDSTRLTRPEPARLKLPHDLESPGAFGFGLLPLGQLVQDISSLVHPAALAAGLRPNFLEARLLAEIVVLRQQVIVLHRKSHRQSWRKLAAQLKASHRPPSLAPSQMANENRQADHRRSLVGTALLRLDDETAHTGACEWLNGRRKESSGCAALSIRVNRARMDWNKSSTPSTPKRRPQFA